LNIYDLLYHDQLVLSREAASELEQLLGNSQGEISSPPAEEAAENTAASNNEEAA